VASPNRRQRASVRATDLELAFPLAGDTAGAGDDARLAGEVWPLNIGQVYTTLQRLERDGLVETDGEGERSQKRYRITASGAEELAGWLRKPPELVPPPRDELVIKVLIAVQIPGLAIHEIDIRRGAYAARMREIDLPAAAFSARTAT
jgi:Transcriptional regulator PadR-like family